MCCFLLPPSSTNRAPKNKKSQGRKINCREGEKKKEKKEIGISQEKDTDVDE